MQTDPHLFSAAPLDRNLVQALSQPVGGLMRPVDALFFEDSLQRAAVELAESGANLLPVARNNVYVGVFSDSILADELARGSSRLDAVGPLAAANPTIGPGESGAAGLRLLESSNADVLVVVNASQQPIGLFSASCLLIPREELPRPGVVGGMATPFGVYLTNGVVKGGVKWPALVATGVTLFAVFFLANSVSVLLEPTLAHSVIPAAYRPTFLSFIATALFAVSFRLLPLSGIHAAEHMVVHALERGEELTPETVARMPRVHPRCGTNLAVAATLFLGIQSLRWPPDESLRILLAFLVTVLTWRFLGSLVQEYVTTRKPNQKQIGLGIAAAEDLLRNFARSGINHSSPLQRLWNSGMFQIMLGSFSVALLLECLAAYVPAFRGLTRFL